MMDTNNKGNCQFRSERDRRDRKCEQRGSEPQRSKTGTSNQRAAVTNRAHRIIGSRKYRALQFSSKKN